MRLFPSILSADFSCLEDSIAPLAEAGLTDIHLDIMDGHFVPNISYGPPVVKSVVKRFPDLCFDAHLMMDNPQLLFKTFLDLGVDSISIHAEIEPDIDWFLRCCRDYEARLGLVFNPDTSIQNHVDKIKKVDYVLLMSVQPGFGGQTFKTEVLDKVPAVRRHLEGPLQIDGGINLKTIKKAARAGFDWFVAGSEVFSNEDPVAAAKNLLAAAGSAKS
ncbi:MAG: ribulose-phosphate 3-epimerase [bacterium]